MLLELVPMLMPAPDTILMPIISEVLIKSPGLGANQLHEAVTPLYCDKTGRTNLRRPHFFKYLGIMRENGSVDARGGRKGRKELELYLTEILIPVEARSRTIAFALSSHTSSIFAISSVV